MNVASLELSRELYKVSQWASTSHVYAWIEFIEDGMSDESVGVVAANSEDAKDGFDCPAYDLGYLLRKVGPYDLTRYSSEWCEMWLLDHPNIIVGDSTEENAVAKLAIELFKKGILKREQNEETE